METLGNEATAATLQIAPGALEAVRREAEAAREASAALSDDAVADALRLMPQLIARERDALLAENEADVAAATGRLDEGSLDRLRLDPARVDELAKQVAAVAELPPLDRVIDEWTLENGLRVEARRIPIGVVGANFEARPAVALDIAAQLLKGLNGCVLRTGSAALRTVSALVDGVVRPALEKAGVAGAAVGLVRHEDHAAAFALASLPELIPLVILRGSGPTTAELGRHAAAHGVAVLAHAEGGGVLYVDRAADRTKAETLIRASLDRLGVCNRLNLLLVHEEVAGWLGDIHALLGTLGITAYGTDDARRFAPLEPLAERLGHEWANDAERVRSLTVDIVSSAEEAWTTANRETSGLAAAIVTDDADTADAFLGHYRGTAAFWHAPTRFADGFALMGVPETGINVGFAPGPRGPVTYRDLWLKQLRIVGDGSQHR
jgi:glutamate-5-semialdehyde dehydrogenase